VTEAAQSFQVRLRDRQPRRTVTTTSSSYTVVVFHI
jgi:hypothetical protein